MANVPLLLYGKMATATHGIQNNPASDGGSFDAHCKSVNTRLWVCYRSLSRQSPAPEEASAGLPMNRALEEAGAAQGGHIAAGYTFHPRAPPRLGLGVHEARRGMDRASAYALSNRILINKWLRIP